LRAGCGQVDRRAVAAQHRSAHPRRVLEDQCVLRVAQHHRDAAALDRQGQLLRLLDLEAQGQRIASAVRARLDAGQRLPSDREHQHPLQQHARAAPIAAPAVAVVERDQHVDIVAGVNQGQVAAVEGPACEDGDGALARLHQAAQVARLSGDGEIAPEQALGRLERHAHRQAEHLAALRGAHRSSFEVRDRDLAHGQRVVAQKLAALQALAQRQHRHALPARELALVAPQVEHQQQAGESRGNQRDLKCTSVHGDQSPVAWAALGRGALSALGAAFAGVQLDRAR
jgi:hypothetical protein